MNQKAAVLLILIAVFSIAVFGVANADTKPQIPDFNVKVIDHSYDVEPTYLTDPFTGKTTVLSAGHRAQNGTIEISIKNQPFNPSGNTNLYYHILAEGHFSDSWSWGYPNSNHGNADYIVASGSEYTTLSFRYGEGYSYPNFPDFPVQAQIDFRVEALIGYATTMEASPGPMWLGYTYVVYTGETSDWSAPKTITIPAGSSTESPSTLPTPLPTATQNPNSTQSETGDSLNFDWMGIALVLLVVAVVGLLIVVVMQQKKLDKISL